MQGQEWGAQVEKRVLCGLCWLMHSSRAWTLAPMTWEVWLWGHHQNSLTSQHLQPALCAPWNIRGRMMHCPSNGEHICSFCEKPLLFQHILHREDCYVFVLAYALTWWQWRVAYYSKDQIALQVQLTDNDCECCRAVAEQFLSNPFGPGKGKYLGIIKNPGWTLLKNIFKIFI